MNDKRKRAILSVVGMVALLIVCVIGVQAVFAGLGMVSAQHGGVSSSQSLPLLRRGPALLLPVGPVLSLLRGAG